MQEGERNLNMKDRDQTWLFGSVKMYSTDQIQDMWNLDILHLYCFSPVTGNADFVQEYYFGDLQHHEQYGFDKMGRSAQVNIFVAIVQIKLLAEMNLVAFVMCHMIQVVEQFYLDNGVSSRNNLGLHAFSGVLMDWQICCSRGN